MIESNKIFSKCCFQENYQLPSPLWIYLFFCIEMTTPNGLTRNWDTCIIWYVCSVFGELSIMWCCHVWQFKQILAYKHFKLDFFVFYAGVKKQYYSKPRIPGVCYATSSVAFGTFDQRGGTLRFENCNSIQLVIPAGALQSMELVYLAVIYEDRDIPDETPTLSPVFDCGPDGLHFEVYNTYLFCTLHTCYKMCLTGWLAKLCFLSVWPFAVLLLSPACPRWS